MVHRAWSSIVEVPYCFWRSSVKFQGHTALKIIEFDPNWAFPDSNSSLNSPMAMKCCTKLETAKERCPIVFQGHPSNFKVTRDKTSPILTQIGRFRIIGRSQLSNPSDCRWWGKCYWHSCTWATSVGNSRRSVGPRPTTFAWDRQLIWLDGPADRQLFWTIKIKIPRCTFPKHRNNTFFTNPRWPQSVYMAWSAIIVSANWLPSKQTHHGRRWYLGIC